MGVKGGFEKDKNIMSKIWVENGYRAFNGFNWRKTGNSGIRLIN